VLLVGNQLRGFVSIHNVDMELLFVEDVKEISVGNVICMIRTQQW
jgi:hypothetical protein